MAESEESFFRFRNLFSNSFTHFDGNSTTFPASSVPRTYLSYLAFLEESSFFPQKPHKNLIAAAAFVASTCHGKKTSNRGSLVLQLQQHIRVDSLGKCLKTPTGPEGITLSFGKTPAESLRMKQGAISHYMFYLAFENTIEPGYVTEKVFDAIIAGVVPIYLGASECRSLLPHPKAAIFVSDFKDIASLAEYLKFLMKNETAYNLHRGWMWNTSTRSTSNSNKIVEKESLPLLIADSKGRMLDPTKQYPLALSSPLLSVSWPCRICQWAQRTMEERKNYKQIQIKQPCWSTDFPRKKKQTVA